MPVAVVPVVAPAEAGAQDGTRPILDSGLRRKDVPISGFLGGVVLSQIVNNALHLAQPLLIAELSGSLGKAAFFSSFDTAIHMAGTFVGGWPADRIGARRLLALSTFLRGVSLAIIPLLWSMGRLTLGWAMAAYTLDALVRGFTDTAVHAVPLEFGLGTREELDRLNSRYELAFDFGAVAGPLLLGALLINKKGFAPHLVIPIGFVLSALAFLSMPQVAESKSRVERGGTFTGWRTVLNNRRLLFSCLGLALLNLYPLRKLLSAFFAKSLVHQKAAAGWIGAAFGIGGIIGSLLYNWRNRSGSLWVALGAGGVLALAVGWLPASVPVMIAAAFLFALTNVGARLAVTRDAQERTPEDAIGGVTAVLRFTSNAASVLLKFIVGLAFAFGAGPRLGFAAVGAALVAVAILQIAYAGRMRRDGA